jgi:hypothetical protein
MAVRQIQIKNDHIERLSLGHLFRGVEGAYPVNGKVNALAITQDFFDKAGILGIIFDQQQPG